MPFLRFSRDKRGVEHFSLVQATANRRGKVRPRVLYWYRSPPDIKVGREPFDPDIRRALEKQYPDISFDWRAIVETPIPSADADKWRERRRAERAAKQAAAAEESADAASAEPDVPADAVTTVEDDSHGADAAFEAALEPAGADSPAAVSATPAAPGGPRAGDPNRKRRRRRRSGGRGGNSGAGAPAPDVPPSPPASGGGPSGD